MKTNNKAIHPIATRRLISSLCINNNELLKKEYNMRKIEVFWVAFVIISLFSAYWFGGESPILY